MLFDFDRFAIGVKLAYAKFKDYPYPLDEVLHIFRYYFEVYEQVLGAAHPMLKFKQIIRIMGKMPYVLDGETEAEAYLYMIPQHFMTDYGECCDYNINHFFSGKIRDLRFYEVCY